MAWTLFSERFMKAARALAEMGVKTGDNVGVYSQNMEQYLVTDFAAFANRAVVVPMYATSSPEQVNYIVNDASIKILLWGSSSSIITRTGQQGVRCRSSSCLIGRCLPTRGYHLGLLR